MNVRGENMLRLARDQKGAVMVEFLVVFMPIFTMFMCIGQLADLYAARMVVQHAASRTARAGAVVFPDAPGGYGQVSKEDQVRAAGYAILAAKRTIVSGQIDVSHGGVNDRTPVDVVIRAHSRCIFPLANRLICGAFASNPTKLLEARASMPAHAARYSY